VTRCIALSTQLLLLLQAFLLSSMKMHWAVRCLPAPSHCLLLSRFFHFAAAAAAAAADVPAVPDEDALAGALPAVCVLFGCRHFVAAAAAAVMQAFLLSF
jgi:hypothetical protein